MAMRLAPATMEMVTCEVETFAATKPDAICSVG